MERIQSTDLPVRLSGGRVSSVNASDLVPPGASELRYTVNRGTEWYCLKCCEFIKPIFIRVSKVIYPACLVCFYEEIEETKTEHDSGVMEGEYVEIPVSNNGSDEAMVASTPTIGDIPTHSNA